MPKTLNFKKKLKLCSFFFLLKNPKGVSLYLAMIILTMFLAIAIGISTVLLIQVKMVSSLGNSVVAFFAADTGIENALYTGSSVSGVLNNGASYEVSFMSPGSGCSGFYYCLKSKGVFKDTKRAIEIIR